MVTRSKPKAAETTEAPETKRYSVAEALEEAGRRRDERMGRPAKETLAAAADNAAAIVDDQADAEPDDAYKSMEYAELQQAAKARELNAGGSADQLKARLREADAAGDQGTSGS